MAVTPDAPATAASHSRRRRGLQPTDPVFRCALSHRDVFGRTSTASGRPVEGRRSRRRCLNSGRLARPCVVRLFRVSRHGPRPSTAKEVGLGVLSRANDDRDCGAPHVLHLSCDHGEDRPDWKRALELQGIRRRHYHCAATTGRSLPPSAKPRPERLPCLRAGSVRPCRRRPATGRPTACWTVGFCEPGYRSSRLSGRARDGTGFSLTVGASRHPMAKSLGACRVWMARGRPPVRYADPFQGFLFPGFDV